MSDPFPAIAKLSFGRQLTQWGVNSSPRCFPLSESVSLGDSLTYCSTDALRNGYPVIGPCLTGMVWEPFGRKHPTQSEKNRACSRRRQPPGRHCRLRSTPTSRGHQVRTEPEGVVNCLGQKRLVTAVEEDARFSLWPSRTSLRRAGVQKDYPT
jgi:hypothetical protein